MGRLRLYANERNAEQSAPPPGRLLRTPGSFFLPSWIPLPVQRLSIFSVFRKAVHANAQLFCSLGRQDRENRQPLSRERASAPGARGEGSSHINLALNTLRKTGFLPNLLSRLGRLGGARTSEAEGGAS